MKVILYGAFGRYNFGDLIFPYILTNYLKKHFENIEIIYCDLLDNDMTKYGGFNVKSIVKYVNIENSIFILVGGEVCGCRLEQGLKMINKNVSKEEQLSLKQNLSSYCYLLKPNNKNIIIANSVGGNLNDKNIKNILNSYDFVTTRNYENNGNFLFSPDCAVLTKNLFDDKIISYKNEIYNDLKITNNEKFIIIQFAKKKVKKESMIKNIKFLRKKFNLKIVLFAAGTAPSHDCLNFYKEIISEINDKSIILFPYENVWKVCCLIANSYICIGTSLHVRILSFIYQKIRFTFFVNNKHIEFIKSCDNIENSYSQTDNINIIEKSIVQNKFKNENNLKNVINKCEKNIIKWINLIKN